MINKLREEFEDKFGHVLFGCKDPYVTTDDLLDFISDKLSQARQEALEEAIEALKNAEDWCCSVVAINVLKTLLIPKHD